MEDYQLERAEFPILLRFPGHLVTVSEIGPDSLVLRNTLGATDQSGVFAEPFGGYLEDDTQKIVIPRTAEPLVSQGQELHLTLPG